MNYYSKHNKCLHFLTFFSVPVTLGPIRGPGQLIPGPATPVKPLFNSFITFLLGFFTILGTIFFLFQLLVGAYTWLNAAGNQNNAAAARTRIFQALLGLIVLIAGYAIVGLIASLFDIQVYNPLQYFPGV
jgi:hypothetical protein